MVSLALSPEQDMLRESVARWVRTELPQDELITWQDRPSSFDARLWEQLAATGWLGLLVPEEFGGAGAELIDAAVLYQELGRAPVPGPLFSTGVLAVEVLVRARPEIASSVLPGIVEGREVIALAVTEADYGWEPENVETVATPDGDGFRVSGTKLFVPDAAGATALLVLARTGPAATDLALLLVDTDDPGVHLRPLPGSLPWHFEVVLDGATVRPDRVVATEQAWSLLRTAMLRSIPVLCAYQVGSGDAVLALALDYSRTRIQFGQPIGKFQRVQDHIIGLVNHLDAARWSTFEAIWALDTDQPGAEAKVHLAKAVTSEGHWELCNAAHEVHAAIGTDLQYPLYQHTVVSRGCYSFLGDPRWHRRAMADALGW